MRFFSRLFPSRSRLLAALLIALVASPSGVSAAERAIELVMFERSGCVWCQRWDREVGKVYPLTDEGKRAPLRKVNIDAGVPSDFRLSPPVFYSPTFVLIADGKEVARITGYAGDDAFWGLFSRYMKDLER